MFNHLHKHHIKSQSHTKTRELRERVSEVDFEDEMRRRKKNSAKEKLEASRCIQYRKYTDFNLFFIHFTSLHN